MVSPAALDLARAFAENVNSLPYPQPQIAIFQWADSRFVRRPRGGPRIELGPGIDLANCDLDEVPLDMIHDAAGFKFAVRMSQHIYEASALRLIDTDSAASSGLTLR
jgi:hypothetical protein